MDYNYKITIKKILKYFILFGLPKAIDYFIISYPDVASLSVGALLVGAVNVLKNKYGIRFL